MNKFNFLHRLNNTGIGLIVVLLYWFFSMYSFFTPAFIPTHDGEFHIIRFFEFSKMINDGHLFPRWAPGLNSGYGLPLFIFHYPFPNYVGSFLHAVGFSYIDSFKLALILGYLVALLACYAIAIRKLSVFQSVSTTVLFGTVPYWFVDITIRGSIGEIWGIAFCMVALASIVWQKKLILGFAILFLCLSHNIMTMLTIPVIAGFLWFTQRQLLLFFLLGIVGSMYFWIPALFESKYMIGLNTTTFSDHFPQFYQLIIPSWGSGFSGPWGAGNEMSQQIGIIPLMICGLGLFVLFRRKVNKKEQIPLIYFLFVFFSACILMLKISLPFWYILTPIQFVQYPWRLLSLIIVSVPFLLLFILPVLRTWMIVLLVLFSIGLTYRYMQPVLYEPRQDDYYITNSNFTDGTSSMGNSFTTIWSAWRQKRPISRVTIKRGEGVVSSLTSQTISDSFTINADTDTTILIHRLYYPGWKVFIDNKSVRINNDEGILEVDVPKGTHMIRTEFGRTILRQFSDLISIVSIILLIVLGTFGNNLQNTFLRKLYEYRF